MIEALCYIEDIGIREVTSIYQLQFQVYQDYIRIHGVTLKASPILFPEYPLTIEVVPARSLLLSQSKQFFL